MSILYNNKSGSTPETILLAGNANTDQILNGTSKNAIANKAVYAALQDKIDKAVQDLVYYYTKSDVYNKAETRALLSTISSLDIKVVNSLPVSDISTTTIYFLKPTGSQNYDEYVYVDNAWVKIGDTSIDLSQYLEIDDFNVAIADYYTSAEVDALINSYYTKSQVDTLLAGKQDPLTFDNTPTAGSNNPVTSTGINTALGTKAGTDKAFMPRGRATETDMDDLLVAGSYVIDPSITTDNTPDDQWGLIEVFQQGEDPATGSTVQVWYGLTGQNYSRFKGGSPLAWSNWKSFGGTQAMALNLHEIVADDPNVVDADTLATYIYENYAATVPNRNQFYRVWVTANPNDSRYTACGQYLKDVYAQNAGYEVSFFEFNFMRKGGNFAECQLKPWEDGAPSIYITYWNNYGGWSTSSALNTNSGWYNENGRGTYVLTTEDLNNITKSGYYFQGSSANCTKANHYPCGINGELDVQKVSTGTVIQKYRPCSTADYPTIFIRRFYKNAWSEWMSTDYVRLLTVTQQTIPATGISIALPCYYVRNCRELAVRCYSYQVSSYWSYGAETYRQMIFITPNGQRIKLYWNHYDDTTGTLYMVDSNNNPVAGSIPKTEILGKLGGLDFPGIHM